MAEDPEAPLNMEILDQGSHYLAVVKTFGITKHPTQIYESITLPVDIVFSCFWDGKKYTSTIPEGLLPGTIPDFRIWDAVRLGVFQGKSGGVLEDNLAFNMGQALSIPLVLAGIGLVFYALKYGKKKNCW